MKYSCTLSGNCVEHQTGMYSSREECEAECRASDQKEIDLLYFQYAPQEAVVYLSPEDQIAVVRRVTGISVAEEVVAQILQALDSEEPEAIARHPELYPYIYQRYGREHGAILMVRAGTNESILEAFQTPNLQLTDEDLLVTFRNITELLSVGTTHLTQLVGRDRLVNRLLDSDVIEELGVRVVDLLHQLGINLTHDAPFPEAVDQQYGHSYLEILLSSFQPELYETLYSHPEYQEEVQDIVDEVLLQPDTPIEFIRWLVQWQPFNLNAEGLAMAASNQVLPYVQVALELQPSLVEEAIRQLESVDLQEAIMWLREKDATE